MPNYNGSDASEGIQGTDQADTIHGNGGNDQIAGAGGSDTLYGDDGDDLILGEAGNDTIWGGNGNDQLDGGLGSDTIRGGSGDDDIWFGSGDTLFGDDGSDLFIAVRGLGVAGITLDGGAGFDLVDFFNAVEVLSLRLNDAASGALHLNNVELVRLGAAGGTVYGGSIGEEIQGGSASDTLNGGGGNDILAGFAGSDVLMGGAGDDYVDGGLGDDVLDGGDGIDTISYAYQGMSVHIDLSITGPQNTQYGLDTITGFEIVIGGAGADILRGGSGNERLEGGGWDDIIAGGAGDDILIGGEGRDVVDYSRAAGGVTVSLAAQGVTNTGGDGVDTLSGFEGIIGSAFDDVLTGDDGDPNTFSSNTFIGGGGNDRIDGGGGHDIVYYGSWAQIGDTAVDLIREIWRDINGVIFVRTADGSLDTLIGVESIGFTNSAIPGMSAGTIGIIHQGTDAADQFYGGSGMDTLRGGAGNDVIHGGPADGSYDGDDTLYGDAGDDQLFGDGGTDTLYGGAGNDRLTGGSFAQNRLYGGTGDDTYFVANHQYRGPDEIYEFSGEGIDTVIFDGSLLGLAANVENLIWVGTLSGTGYYTGVFGNDLANTITGNVGNNDISGEGGSDIISGGDGNDRIWAEGRDRFQTVGLGNDTIHGDGGADIIYGGAGADLLYGDDGADTVTGAAGADTLSGGAGTDDLSGGQGDDLISGDADADSLKGDAGADTLTGGAGNDTIDGGADLDVAVFSGVRSAYTVTIAGPTVTVTGPDGTDTLNNVERLRFADQEMSLAGLVGTEGADTLPGSSGDDDLYGADGDDIFLGTAGDDIFDGGDGSDTVDYRNAVAGVTVNLGLTTSQAVGGGQGSDRFNSVENLTGSAFADRLTGVTGSRVDGGAGDDILSSLNFGASLLGGAGADILLFDQLGLSIEGVSGAVLNGGSGIDTLDARSAAYDIYVDYQYGGTMRVGGAFGPVGYGLLNVERFLTGSGDDYLELTNLTVSVNIQSGAGDDYVATTYNASSTIDAGDGDDTVEAAANYYSVAHGGAGDDEIRFNQNSDVFGDAGDDLFSGLLSNPGTGAYAIVDGGDGVDTLRILGSQHVNLSTGYYNAESGSRLAQLTSIENVELRVGYSGGGGSATGNDGANVLVATSSDGQITRVDLFGLGGDDILGGHFGNDLLEGGDGDDTLTGGLGNDTIRGGAGEDTATFARQRSAYTVTVLEDRVTVSGPDGSDTLWDVEWLAFADQRIEIPRPMILVGGAGDDSLIGNAMNDSLSGGDGNDTLAGGGGDDTLNGGLGNDRIDGGSGHDVLTVSGAASGYRLLMDGDNFILKGPDGTDRLIGVEAIRFSDGRLLELNRMYGPDVDARAWADGRIPEGLLSGADWSEDRPLVLPGAADDDGLVVKGDGGPEVLPVSDEADAWIWKDSDAPLVLPGAPDLFVADAKGGDAFEVLPGVDERSLFAFEPVVRPEPWSGQMLTIDEQGRIVDQYGHGGWSPDDWGL